MSEISPIKQRILDFAFNRKLKKTDFCTKAGISYANLKGTGLASEFGGLQISRVLLAYPELSAEWLLTGKGEMLNYQSAGSIQKAINIGLPLLTLESMNCFVRGDYTGECQRYIVPVFAGAHFLVSVNGLSMMSTYKSGDIVACKQIELKDLFFQWNKVYLLDTAQGFVIGRVKPADNDTRIMRVPDNANYLPFEVPRKQIRLVALIIGAIKVE